MAITFKASALFYCAVCFFCISFVSALAFYHDRFIPDLPSLHGVYELMVATAAYNCTACIFGIIFLTCEITHIIPAMLFLLSLIAVNIAVCPLALYQLANMKPPPQNEMLNETIKNFQSTVQMEHDWLLHTEQINNCCGVYSYLDYPLYLNLNNKTKLSDIIPWSCCRDRRNINECKDRLNKFESLEQNPAGLASTTFQKLYLNLKCTNHSKFSGRVYVAKEGFAPDFTRNTRISEIIDTCGCYEKLHVNFRSLLNSLYSFFVCTIIGVILMVYLYLKFWIKFILRRARHKHGFGSGSQISGLSFNKKPKSIKDKNIETIGPKQEGNQRLSNTVRLSLASRH